MTWSLALSHKNASKHHCIQIKNSYSSESKVATNGNSAFNINIIMYGTYCNFNHVTLQQPLFFQFLFWISLDQNEKKETRNVFTNIADLNTTTHTCIHGLLIFITSLSKPTHTRYNKQWYENAKSEKQNLTKIRSFHSIHFIFTSPSKFVNKLVFSTLINNKFIVCVLT